MENENLENLEIDKNLDDLEIDRNEDSSENDFNPEEFSKEQYKIDKVEELVDVDSGEIIDRENLTPMDYIRAIAKKTGNIIKEPKSSCKHCYGRGHINYVAPDSKTIPIPCRCIYTKEGLAAENKMHIATNRQQKRKLEKVTMKMAKEYRRIIKNKGLEELKKKEEIEANGKS